MHNFVLFLHVCNYPNGTDAQSPHFLHDFRNIFLAYSSLSQSSNAKTIFHVKSAYWSDCSVCRIIFEMPRYPNLFLENNYTNSMEDFLCMNGKFSVFLWKTSKHWAIFGYKCFVISTFERFKAFLPIVWGNRCRSRRFSIWRRKKIFRTEFDVTHIHWANLRSGK